MNYRSAIRVHGGIDPLVIAASISLVSGSAITIPLIIDVVFSGDIECTTIPVLQASIAGRSYIDTIDELMIPNQAMYLSRDAGQHLASIPRTRFN